MKTRPVFESFSDFVDFLNFPSSDGKSDFMFEAEGITVEEFNSRLSSFFDKDAKAAFEGLKKSIMGSPFFMNPENEFETDLIKRHLRKLALQIENAQEAESEDKSAVQIDYLGTSISELEVTQVVNGQIKLVGYPGTPSDSKNGFQENNWADLNTVLANTSSRNINLCDFPVELKDKKWQMLKKLDVVAGSGSQNQTVVSDLSAGVNFVEIPYERNKVTVLEPVTNVQGMDNLDQSYISKKAVAVQRLLVIYSLKRIIKGVGDNIPTTLIKKTFVNTVVEGEKVTTERNLKGTDKMFSQGSAELDPKQKEVTKQSVENLLSDFISIDSIVITGGASFEGGLDVNKKLVVDRATTVRNLILSMHPELSGKVTINESEEEKTGKYSKIQSKDVPAEYPEWRKIYLNVTGTVQGDPSIVKEEKTSLVGGNIKSDKAIINQYVIGFEFNR